MISFDEAIALVCGVAEPLGSEPVLLTKAHRRVLAESVVARVSAPPADVSAMDGYAVREADLQALPTRLPIAGESFAGNGFEGELPAGQCVRIFTGAPVPAGADRVMVQEVVRREGDQAIFAEPLGAARHIRLAGSDFRNGETLLDAGTLLRPGALVAVAGADVAELTVWRRPRIAILGTGDELVEPGTAREQVGCIPESVSFGVAALAEEAGAEVAGTVRLPDNLSRMRSVAAQMLQIADVVVVTGGASVGERDFAKAMWDELGLEILFSKVAIKPGKPVWLGRVGGKLVIGLPGNPTSALVTGRLFLVPLLQGLGGRAPCQALAWRRLPLAAPLAPTGSRETFSRAFADGGKVQLFDHQDSSSQKVLAAATLLVRRRSGENPVPAGSLVEVLDF